MINIKNDELRVKILEFVNEYKQKPLSERQNILKIQNYSGQISYSSLERELDDLLIHERFPEYNLDTINDNLIGMKELDFIEASCSKVGSVIFRVKEKGYEYLKNDGKDEPLKIEITNTQPLLDALVSHTNISKEFGEKLLDQLKIFSQLQKESNFYKADELEVLKIQLQELKKENSKINWDLLIGIIGIIQPLLK